MLPRAEVERRCDGLSPPRSTQADSTKGASIRRHSMSIPKRVGCVAALWRYPVKSMAGEALEHAQVSWHGVPGDRRWAFIRKDMVSSGFPWLTIRERPDLWRYCPSF